MKPKHVLKVLALIVLGVGLLVLASWASTFWGMAIGLLGGFLPAGNDPIANALRGWLPAAKSAGTVIVLVVAGFFGWDLGRRIWTM